MNESQPIVIELSLALRQPVFLSRVQADDEIGESGLPKFGGIDFAIVATLEPLHQGDGIAEGKEDFTAAFFPLVNENGTEVVADPRGDCPIAQSLSACEERLYGSEGQDADVGEMGLAGAFDNLPCRSRCATAPPELALEFVGGFGFAANWMDGEGRCLGRRVVAIEISLLAQPVLRFH